MNNRYVYRIYNNELRSYDPKIFQYEFEAIEILLRITKFENQYQIVRFRLVEDNKNE